MRHRKSTLVRVAAGAIGMLCLLVAVPALAEVYRETGFGFPKDVSVDGWRIDQLINVTTVFVLLLFGVMCVWIFWACFFHGRDHEAHYDHGTASNSIVQALVISTFIFVIVDGNLFYNSMVDLNEAFWNFDKAESTPNAVRIEVNARQWAWQVRYAGNDGKFNTADDVEILNEIKIPVDAPVIIQVAAVDVIHSLYLPNVRAKIDVVPGSINKLWFQAKETGEFDVACAQHCGTHHYKMKGLLRIIQRADFDAWLKDASVTAALHHDPTDTEAMWGWAWRKETDKHANSLPRPLDLAPPVDQPAEGDDGDDDGDEG